MPRCWITGFLLLAACAPAGCGGDEASTGSSSLPAPSAAPRVSEEQVGGAPSAIAVGEGGVWVADGEKALLLRLDPRTGRLDGRPVPVAPGPTAVAAGEGAVWVASAADSVSRIDPESQERVGRPTRIEDPTGIAAGEGGVWVASGSAGTLNRIDPDTGDVVAPPIEVGARPTDVAVGAGSVWVANTDDGTVSRVDPASGETAEPISVAEEQVLGLTYGEDGVWVAKTDDLLAKRIEVVRVDPATGEVDEEAVMLGGAAIPVRVAAGEGFVWATILGGIRPPQKAKPSSVLRIDPAARELVGDPTPVGEHPAGIAVGSSAAWVASSGAGTVSRLEPRP